MSVLTDAEIQAVVMARIAGGNGSPVTRPEIDAAVNWAESVAVDAGLLRLVLSGELKIGGNPTDAEGYRFAIRGAR